MTTTTTTPPQCKPQVLVCTSTLAWGVNFPAHLVVVKGTEFFDGKSQRYVDFPITDLLQVWYLLPAVASPPCAFRHCFVFSTVLGVCVTNRVMCDGTVFGLPGFFGGGRTRGLEAQETGSTILCRRAYPTAPPTVNVKTAFDGFGWRFNCRCCISAYKHQRVCLVSQHEETETATQPNETTRVSFSTNAAVCRRQHRSLYRARCITRSVAFGGWGFCHRAVGFDPPVNHPAHGKSPRRCSGERFKVASNGV